MNLDCEGFANYRPIRNLYFKSKLLERAVFVQLTEYLKAIICFVIFELLIERFPQLNCSKNWSWKVTNDIFLNLELKDTFYIGLDLSEDFDTHDTFVDSPLFKHLQWWIADCVALRAGFEEGNTRFGLMPLAFNRLFVAIRVFFNSCESNISLLILLWFTLSTVVRQLRRVSI